MKAYAITKERGLQQVVLTDRGTPVPGEGEVRIKVRAVSLNSRDTGVVNGFYGSNFEHPIIPVSDGVGIVEALGEQTSRFKKGDRVSGTFVQGWISGEASEGWLSRTLGSPLDGMLAEYVVLHEDGLVHVPEHLTDEEAAALPCAGVTAWHAIVTEGKVKAGDAVVVQGTGGVSLFALQFAKLHGASVIVTSSSDEKLERAMKLGADYGVNYRDNPDWDKAVLEWTNGQGADHIVELGGGDTLNRSIEAARIGGRISLIGILSGHTVDDFNIMSVFRKRVTLQGINVGNRDMFEAMNQTIGQNKLRPVIDRIFPFEQALDAFRYLAGRTYFGKIVITV